MKKTLKHLILSLILASFVFVSYFGFTGTIQAQGNQNTTTSVSFSVCDLGPNAKLQNLFNYVSCIITKSVVPLIFTLAFAFFMWGVVQFIMNSEDEAKRAKGKQFMLWGIIALFVMFAVWGLVALLGETFNVDTTIIPQLPEN